jgi:hypothetical protein
MTNQTYKDFNVVSVEITNTDYFFMVDNQVRDIFAKFEETVILPKVEHLYNINKINHSVLKEYPIEGYYYKTKALTRYFKLIRNIQHNSLVYENIDIETPEFMLIKNICDRDIFGTIPSDGLSPLPRRKDIMTICMEIMKEGWSIENIMSNLDNYKTGNANLVELAYLTKNPACLTSGCETNSLYRMFALISGCYIGKMIPTVYEYVWLVDKEVEDLGTNLVAEYNKIFDMFELGKYNQYIGTNLSKRYLVAPSVKLCGDLDKKAETPRVAFLGHNLAAATNYYWILEKNMTVRDLWSKNFLTTKSYMETGDKGIPYNMANMLEGQTEKNEAWGNNLEPQDIHKLVLNAQRIGE